MAKALVGYMAAWGSVKFNLEHTLPRFFLTGSLILVHSLILVGLRLALLEVPPLSQPLDLASTVLVNVAVALTLFQPLDRFKQPALRLGSPTRIADC